MKRCERIEGFSSGELRGRVRFGETLVDRGQQRVWRERFAQADRGTKIKGHLKEVGRGRIEIRKSVAGHGDQRNRRRMFVEYPDRFRSRAYAA